MQKKNRKNFQEVSPSEQFIKNQSNTNEKQIDSSSFFLSLYQSLRKYEECYESARRAKDSYEKAHEDLDLSRAQLEKARDTMTMKSKKCDDAHTNYSSDVSI